MKAWTLLNQLSLFYKLSEQITQGQGTGDGQLRVTNGRDAGAWGPGWFAYLLMVYLMTLSVFSSLVN